MTRATEVLGYLADNELNDCYGAAIARSIGVSAGAVYQQLAKLQMSGLATSVRESGDTKILQRPLRTYYRITELGRERLAIDKAAKPAAPIKSRRPVAPGTLASLMDHWRAAPAHVQADFLRFVQLAAAVVPAAIPHPKELQQVTSPASAGASAAARGVRPEDRYGRPARVLGGSLKRGI
jgi:DNA-binding PadR family transcriptional regulator